MSIKRGMALLGLGLALVSGAPKAAVNLAYQATDLVRHNYFRLSPQASFVDGAGTLHVFARDSGLVERRLEDGAWVNETVDPYVGAGHDLSASIGPDGVIHVLYNAKIPCLDCGTPGLATSDLRYARKVAGIWQITELGPGLRDVLLASQTRGIAGGAGGTLDVFGYADNFSPGIYHSHFDGSVWNIEQLLGSGVATGTDLRLVGLSRAPDGSLHAAFLDPALDGGERLYYFRKAVGGAWQSQVVKDYLNTDNIQWFIGIVGTDSSTAHILVSSFDTLDHHRVTAGSVETFVLDNAGQPFIGRITYPTLVAAAGQPLTTAFNVTTSSNASQDWYQLWTARFDGLGWSAEKVYGTGQYGSGTPVPELVDPPQLHYANGVLHVINKETGYFRALPGQVQPVSDWTKPLLAWDRSTVIESQARVSVPGKQIVATADAQGKLHALHFVEALDSFTIFDGGTAMYTAETNGSPVSERLPAGAEGLAIAVAPDGTVHGMLEGNNVLQHVARTNGNWTVDDIAAPIYHVNDSRMAMTLDAGESVHACLYKKIAVASQERVQLSYVTNAAGSWTQEPIAADLGVAIGHHMACAIRILADDSLHVAYVDTNGDLHKATRGAGGWSHVRITDQPVPNQRQQISPLIDADGFVHASFTLLIPFGPSYIPNGIRYGNNRGVIWAEELVDDDVQLGIAVDYLYRSEIEDYSPLYRSRIAQAPDGRIHVFYYDEGLYSARGSVRVDGAWRNVHVDLTESSGPFGDVVPMPDSTVRYVYAVEKSAAIRASTPSPGPALFLHGNLTFPETVVGGSVTRSFNVTNRGSQALSLTSVALLADSYTFGPSSTCPGAVLQPGQSCTVLIEYEPAPYETQPTTSSERAGLLRFQSNDPWSPVDFRLVGLTFPASEGGGGGGGVPPSALIALLAMALARRRRSRG